MEKKTDRVRQLLALGASPREAARETGCSLSLVYSVRGLTGMTRIAHDVAVIKEDLREIHESLRRLKGNPGDVIQRIFEEGLQREVHSREFRPAADAQSSGSPQGETRK
jgi:hypothetical protein